MIDSKKICLKIQLEIISLWIEALKDKDILCSNEKEAISIISNYILEELMK